MALLELFDKIGTFSFGKDRGSFEVNGKQYSVKMSRYGDDNEGIELLFWLANPVNTQKSNSMYGMNATGTGDELMVFATLLRLLRDYLRRYPAQIVSFTANESEPSRVKLYDRFATKFGSDWTVHTYSELDYKNYVLTRKPGDDNDTD